MTPQERAERVAEAMWEKDAATRSVGIELAEIAPDRAIMTLRVNERHLNGHGTCHGGFIFTLADSAFAFACNSANQLTVGQDNQITFIRPGALGETLTATAVAVASAGRSGVYDVTVTGGDGRVVALMRGLSRQIKGQHIPELPEHT